MPLYEYQCEACSKRFERIQKYSDPLVEVCPTCGGRVKKLLSSPAIQFKGAGWYVNDYATKSGSDSSPAPDTAKSADKDAGSKKSGEGATGSESTSSASDKGSKSEGSSKSESKGESKPAPAAPAPSTTKD